MIKNIPRRLMAFAATLVLALSSLAVATPKRERAERLTIYGRVLKIDKQERTLLVNDHWTKKLYLISVPEGATFKITFGQSMHMSEPGLGDVNKNNVVRMLCVRKDNEHLSRLDDGRQAIVLTVAQ
jgi:hypothetical protein